MTHLRFFAHAFSNFFDVSFQLKSFVAFALSCTNVTADTLGRIHCTKDVILSINIIFVGIEKITKNCFKRLSLKIDLCSKVLNLKVNVREYTYIKLEDYIQVKSNRAILPH